MNTLYKTLFEVRILHGFYQTDSDGSSIFDLPPAGRTTFLANRLARGERSITSDLRFIIPEPAMATYSNYHLRLLSTYSGYKVAVECNRITGGPLTEFAPKVPLPASLNIPLLIMRTGTDLDAISNTRMLRNLQTAFYFSNETVFNAKTAPFLSEPVPALDGGYAYEQGELALHGPADIRSFYRDELNAPQWLSIPNGGYANEKDRFLVKPDFNYLFLPGENINNVSFTLRDSFNTIIDTITAKKASGFFARLPLSFDVLKLKTIPQSSFANTLIYTLQVAGNGGYNKTFRLVFLRDVTTSLRDTWGLVNIANKTANPLFQLTDVNNRLTLKLNADGTVNTPAPVFEIWIKNRLPFWRYINDRKKKLKGLPHAGLLYEAGDTLVSLKPQPLSYTPTLLKKPDNSMHYRPNPKLFSMLKTEGGRVFADITVPESELFPLGP